MATASAQTVRIGMTAADIPKTVGQPDQGFEGNRFTGNTMYEGLTTWDLSSADKASVVIPGVATEWAVVADRPDQMDLQAALRREIPRRLGLRCRRGGVERREGAEAGRARTSTPSQVGVTASRMPNLRSAKAIDKMTVELTTAAPDALLPINLTNLYMASPAQWKKLFDAVPASVSRPEGARQAGVGRVRAQRLRHRPVEDGQVRAARAARTGEERGLLGREARAEGRPAGAAADAGSERPHRGAALRPGRLDREPGAGRAAADQAARLRASTRTNSRTSGRGSSAASKARPGTTSACARRPTSASTATP